MTPDMRRLLLLFTGLMGFGLNQADTYPPEYLQCFQSRAPTYFAALHRADACVDYDGTDANECDTSNRPLSDPDFCTLVGTSFEGGDPGSVVYCKTFTSVVSQFCSLIDMEINSNIVAADLNVIFQTTEQTGVLPAGFWVELLYGVPELYNESCRDIIRNYASTEVQAYSDLVNIMCKNRDSSEDDNMLAIGLGVGLGVGIPFIGGLVYLIVKRSKKAETTESIEPFLK